MISTETRAPSMPIPLPAAAPARAATGTEPADAEMSLAFMTLLGMFAKPATNAPTSPVAAWHAALGVPLGPQQGEGSQDQPSTLAAAPAPDVDANAAVATELTAVTVPAMAQPRLVNVIAPRPPLVPMSARDARELGDGNPPRAVVAVEVSSALVPKAPMIAAVNDAVGNATAITQRMPVEHVDLDTMPAPVASNRPRPKHSSAHQPAQRATNIVTADVADVPDQLMPIGVAAAAVEMPAVDTDAAVQSNAQPAESHAVESAPAVAVPQWELIVAAAALAATRKPIETPAAPTAPNAALPHGSDTDAGESAATSTRPMSTLISHHAASRSAAEGSLSAPSRTLHEMIYDRNPAPSAPTTAAADGAQPGLPADSTVNRAADVAAEVPVLREWIASITEHRAAPDSTAATAHAATPAVSEGTGRSPQGRSDQRERRERTVGAAVDASVASNPADVAVTAHVAPPVARTHAAPTVERAASSTPVHLREPSARPTLTSQVTVDLDPALGAGKVRVAVRGEAVHATILTRESEVSALASRSHELRATLESRGFEDAQVTIRSITGDNGAAPATAMRPAGEELRSSGARDSRNDNGSDQQQSQRQQWRDASEERHSRRRPVYDEEELG